MSVCCCGGEKPSFAVDALMTPVGKIWRVAHNWSSGDWAGALAMRLDIGRMNYAVAPGLYASGNPTDVSPVFVTANYKLTVDHVRRAIKGLDAWLLVLDTKGVNVWCAAGKGTFGTDELVSRIAACRLSELVKHRTLIVPQLGATGIAAHEVFARSFFKVVYAPVRATDLPRFLADGMKATPAMRTVTFNLSERIAVIPVEVVHWSKWLLALLVVCALAAAVGAGDYSPRGFALSAIRMVTAFLGGVVMGPILFPWLPGRAFAIKGVFAGILTLLFMAGVGLLPVHGTAELLQSCGWGLLTLGAASFLMLAYTGSSPYTSLSGTRIETRIGFRLQSIAAVVGILLLLLPRLMK